MSYKIDQFYDMLQQGGINMPTKEEFAKNMTDPKYRKTLYEGLQAKGFKQPEYDAYESFWSKNLPRLNTNDTSKTYGVMASDAYTNRYTRQAEEQRIDQETKAEDAKNKQIADNYNAMSKLEDTFAAYEQSQDVAELFPGAKSESSTTWRDRVAQRKEGEAQAKAEADQEREKLRQRMQLLKDNPDAWEKSLEQPLQTNAPEVGLRSMESFANGKPVDKRGNAHDNWVSQAQANQRIDAEDKARQLGMQADEIQDMLADPMALDKEMSKLKAELAELTKQRDAYGSQFAKEHPWQMMANLMGRDSFDNPYEVGMYGVDAMETQKQMNNVIARINMLTEAKNAFERGSWSGHGFWNNVKNIGKGMQQFATEINSYTDKYDIESGMALNHLANKIERGEMLTDEEMSWFVTAKLKEEGEKAASQGPTTGAVGYGAPASVEYMVTMALNPARGASKTISDKIIEAGVRRFGKSAFTKMMAKATGMLTEGAVLSTTLGADNVASDALGRMAGKVGFDDSGNVAVADRVNPLKAMYQSTMASTIESAVEMMGVPIIGKATKGIGKVATKLADAMSYGKVSKLLSAMDKSQIVNWTKGMSKATGWQGLGEEWGEENVTMLANAIIVGDNEIADMFDTRTQLEILGTCALISGVMSTANVAGFAGEFHKVNREFKKAKQEVLRQFSSDAWASLDNLITNAQDEDLTVRLADAMDGMAMNQEQRSAIMNYLTALKKYQKFNELNDGGKFIIGGPQAQATQSTSTSIYEIDSDITLKDEIGNPIDARIIGRDANGNYMVESSQPINGKRVQPMSADQLDAMVIPNTPDGIQQSEVDGYNLTDANQQAEVSMLTDNARESVATLLGVTPDAVDVALQQVLGDNPTDAKIDARFGGNAQVVKDYMYNVAKTKGMSARLIDDIADATAESDRAIDAVNNNGNVVTAILGKEKVNITSGEVVTFDDGVVDKANSSKSVTIKHADGTTEMVAPTSLTEVVSMPTEQAKATQAQAIAQQKQQAFADAMSGALDYSQGQQYTMLNADGSTTDVTILADNGDGNVTVTARDGNKEGGVTDGKQIVLPKSQIQQGVREFKRNQLRADNAQQTSIPQAEAEVAEPTQEPSMPTDEQGNIMYEQMDADSAWDALLAETGGDADMAMTVANEMIADKTKAVEEASKMVAEPGTTPQEKIANLKAVKQAQAQAQAELDAWKAIAEAPNRRMSLQTEQTDLQTELQTELQGQQVADKLPASEEVTTETPTESESTPQVGLVEDARTRTLGDKTRKMLDAMAKRLGLQVEFVDEIVTGKDEKGRNLYANAVIVGKNVKIAWHNRNRAIDFLLGHEFTHRMQDLSPEAYAEFVEATKQALGEEELNKRIKDMRDIYKSQGKTISEQGIIDEVVADYAGELVEERGVFDNFVERNKNNRDLLSAIADVLRSIKEFFTLGKQRKINNAIARLEALIESASEANLRGDVVVNDKHSLPTEDRFSIPVYHGSGVEFSEFDHTHMGEGEGNQAFGWGTYVTEVKGIAKMYAGANGATMLTYKGNELDTDGLLNQWRVIKDLYDENKGRLREMRNRAERILSLVEEDNTEMKQLWQSVVDTLKQVRAGDLKVKPKRYIYNVEIPDNTGKNYLDYYDEMPKKAINEVRNKLESILAQGDYKGVEKELKRELDSVFVDGLTASDVYGNVSAYLGGDKQASEFFNEMGYVGIKYPTNSMSGNKQSKDSNYVIFKESDAKIIDNKRFSLANLTAEEQRIVDEAKANGTYMKAPNGKASNLNERQWIQVRTKAFKDWFGDWENDPENASKVVDENGEPKVVYHQTNRTIYRNVENGKLWDDLDWQEKQEWEERDDWDEYWEEEDFYEFSRTNARTTNEFDGFFFAPKYDEYHEYGDRTIEAFLNIRKPASQADYNIDAQYNDAGKKERIRLQEEGYDGVIRMEGDEVDEYIAFEPTQIKSATDNVGTFDASNPDIRYSLQGAFYSNAHHAVEDIKQDKATPQQWIAMLKKNGGLKAGEDKWLGLEDWLNQQSGSVTKQDIIDYINANSIKIEEVEYEGEIPQYFENPEFEDFSFTTKGIEEWQKRYGVFEFDYYPNLNFEFLGTPKERLASAIEANNKANLVNVDVYDLDDESDAEMFINEVEAEIMHDADNWMYFMDEDIENPINTTRLIYTTKGLEGKREIALTVPTIDPYNQSDDIHFGDAGDGRAVAWIRFGETEDAEGNRVLVIDEIQSKRHQDGREKGYRDSNHHEQFENARKAYANAAEAHSDFVAEMKEKYGDPMVVRGTAEERKEARKAWKMQWSVEELGKYDELTDKMHDARKVYDAISDRRSGVPSAPFEKNWQELAMKRMLRYATDFGFDKLAWTTGEQQAKRYDIGTSVNHIHVINSEEERYVSVSPNNGRIIELPTEPDSDVIVSGEYKDQRLQDVFGKELAEKILSVGIGEDVRLAGESLRIGGEGMKGFYDKMLPSFMNKYGKKWGVKVGEVTMPYLEEGYQTMHSVDITDAMREDVRKGQPLFSLQGGRSIADKYEKRVNTKGKGGAMHLSKFNAQEAFQDEQLSLKEVQRIIEQEYGIVLESYEDAYMAENAMSSIAKASWDRYIKEVYEPMMRIHDEWIRSDESNESINHYLIAKSGLERNRELMVRDALAEMNKMDAQIINGEYSGTVLRLANALRQGQISQDEYDAQVQEAKDKKAQALEDVKSVQQGRVDAYRAERDALREQLKNGDISYEEFNKLSDEVALKHAKAEEIADYSGLTALAKMHGSKDWQGFAEQMVRDFEAKHSNTDVMWEHINNNTKSAVDYSYKSGVTSKQAKDHLDQMFLWYVPMKGNADVEAEDIYTYVNDKSSSFTPTVKGAKGHSEYVSEDVMALIANTMQSAILQGERNKVKQKFLNMVENYPTDLFTLDRGWVVMQGNDWVESHPEIKADYTPEQIREAIEKHDAEMQELAEQGLAMSKEGALRLGVPFRATQNEQEHAISVMRNGQKVTIYVNGNPRVAQAVNGKLKDTKESLGMRLWHTFTRWLSAGMTGYSIDFTGANLSRDTHHSSAIMFLKYGFKEQIRYILNGFADLPALIRGISGKSGNTKRDAYFQEFLANGGETGYANLRSLDDWKVENKKRIGRLKTMGGKAWGHTRNVLPYIAEAFGYINRLAETSSRFNAYVRARERNQDVATAVSEAKNITVNFNKKGTNKTAGAFGTLAKLYRETMMFANPVIQGLYQFLKVGKEHKGRFTVLCLGHVALGGVVPILNQMLFELLGGDDEDEYYNQSEYQRRTNLLIYTGHGYIKIPLAPIFRELYALGDVFYGVIQKKIKMEDGARDVVGLVRSMFSIEGQSAIDDDWSLVRFILPEQLSVVADISDNVNFMGMPIYKDSDYLRFDPEYQKVYKNAWSPLVATSAKLNELLGGDEDSAPRNANDMWLNPAIWQHVISSIGGGPLKTIGDILDISDRAISGEDLSISNIPVAKRFFMKPDERTLINAVNREYYDIKEDMAWVEDRVRKFNRKEYSGYAGYAEKLDFMYHSPDYLKYAIFEEGNKEIEKLDKKIKEEVDEKEIENLKAMSATKKDQLIAKVNAVDRITETDSKDPLLAHYIGKDVAYKMRKRLKQAQIADVDNPGALSEYTQTPEFEIDMEIAAYVNQIAQIDYYLNDDLMRLLTGQSRVQLEATKASLREALVELREAYEKRLKNKEEGEQ